MRISQRTLLARSRARFAVTATLTILLALCGSAALAEGGEHRAWEQIRAEDGVTTWMREQPGQELATFRARSELPVSLWNLLAVLEDVDRASEWTANCEEMRRIDTTLALPKVHAEHSAGSPMLVYARMDAPWPVRDRDVITAVTSSYVGENGLLVTIRSTSYPAIPPQPGLVRIPKMVASYRFDVLSEQRTRVEYQIDLDPGGTLPDWLKTLVARDLAHNTLSRLRERVRWAVQQGLYRVRAGELQSIARAQGFGGSIDQSKVSSPPNLAAAGE